MIARCLVMSVSIPWLLGMAFPIPDLAMLIMLRPDFGMPKKLVLPQTLRFWTLAPLELFTLLFTVQTDSELLQNGTLPKF